MVIIGNKDYFVLFYSCFSQLSVCEHQWAGWTRTGLHKGGSSFIPDHQSSMQQLLCVAEAPPTDGYTTAPPTWGFEDSLPVGVPDTSVVPRLPAALQPWPHSWLLLCWLSPPCVLQPLLSPTAKSWSSPWSWTATVLWVSVSLLVLSRSVELLT